MDRSPCAWCGAPTAVGAVVYRRGDSSRGELCPSCSDYARELMADARSDRLRAPS